MGGAALGGPSALSVRAREFCARRSPGGRWNRAAFFPAASRTASLVGDGDGGHRADRLSVEVGLQGARALNPLAGGSG